MANREQQRDMDTQRTGETGHTSANEGPVSDRERNVSVAQEGIRDRERSRALRRLRGEDDGRYDITPMMSPFLSNPAMFFANPWAFSEAMRREMDQFFSADDWLGQPAGAMSTRRKSGRMWHPKIETFQRDNELVVSADLPGLDPDDVHVDVENGILTISGERRQSHEDSSEDGYYRSERSYGAFSRSITLPDNVDEDKINARFDKGVLEVTMPLPEQRQRSRRIQVR